MDYEKVGKDVLELVGGKENVINLQHCMTRLRFDLKDESYANDEGIRNLDGVITLIKKGGQYQVVIGTKVHDVYQSINQLMGINENVEDEKKSEKKSLPSMMIGAIIGAIGPILPILIGTGLGKCILMMLTTFGLVNAESSFTYYIFNFAFDAGFTFLPVFVAISAARYFKCNMYIAALLGAIMIHPAWNEIVNALDPKIVGKIFGFVPVYGMSYTSSLIPAILVVWILSKLEHGLKKVIPDLLRDMFIPLLSLLIMIPLTFVVLAPSMGIISMYIGEAMMWIFNSFGMFAIAIMCIFYPWIVTTGMHAPIAVGGLQILSQSGYDPISRTLTLTANMAQSATCLAVALKTKNKEFRTICISAFFTAIIAGVTEPAIYGVSLRLKKPMYAVTIGSTVAGLYAGIVGLKAYAFMTPSVVNFPMWMGGESNSNLINAFITMLIAGVVTFVATLVLGFEDPVDETTASASKNQVYSLNSPIAGRIVPLSNVNDEMFSRELLGRGVAVDPTEGKLVAPTSGVISATFETKHAIGLTTDDGIELLLHVGIDTVELNGELFTQLVKKGDRVEKGELMINFDLMALKESGYDPTTIIVVTNSSDFLEIIPNTPTNRDEEFTLDDELLTVI